MPPPWKWCIGYLSFAFQLAGRTRRESPACEKELWAPMNSMFIALPTIKAGNKIIYCQAELPFWGSSTTRFSQFLEENPWGEINLRLLAKGLTIIYANYSVQGKGNIPLHAHFHINCALMLQNIYIQKPLAVKTDDVVFEAVSSKAKPDCQSTLAMRQQSKWYEALKSWELKQKSVLVPYVSPPLQAYLWKREISSYCIQKLKLAFLTCSERAMCCPLHCGLGINRSTISIQERWAWIYSACN